MAAREVEKADEARTFGVFPAEWGVPAGARFSEERARWVRERVQEHQTLQRVQRRARAAAPPSGGEHVRRQRELLMRRRAA